MDPDVNRIGEFSRFEKICNENKKTKTVQFKLDNFDTSPSIHCSFLTDLYRIWLGVHTPK